MPFKENGHHEWTSNLIANGKDKKSVNRTKAFMDKNFPDAIVTRYKSLIKDLILPDQNDRHVLAVAIKAHRSSLKNPPFVTHEYIQARAKQGLKVFSTFLKANEQQI